MEASDTIKDFTGMIEANKGIIYKVAGLYCAHAGDRPDLVQEIILQLWLAFPKYDDRYKISTWVYRIALNVSISFYRYESRRRPLRGSMPELLYIPAEEECGEMRDGTERLHRFIKELKELDRALVLLYLDNNSYREMADILGMSLTQVSTRLSRIKQQLRHKFSTIQ